MTRFQIDGDRLTPWDEDLVMTLRGPIVVKQMAVYQPGSATASAWQLVSSWDARTQAMPRGIAFKGNQTETRGFAGVVGNECLVDVTTDREFTCGPGSVPYCPTVPAGMHQYLGWTGAKLLVLLASMPHADSPDLPAASNCGMGTANNWYDAPWIGLSHGELIRAGKFGSCQCYAKDPAKWFLADGCGQFNVFEVVNDNNQFRNLDVFSTNLFGYQGYIGQGPCGSACNVSVLGPEVDLLDKATSTEAKAGASVTPTGGPGAAFRRPSAGYRFFLILLDVDQRAIQLAVVHPDRIPATLAPLLPGLPGQLAQTAVADLLRLRLPH
jgi:hypothetical protein